MNHDGSFFRIVLVHQKIKSCGKGMGRDIAKIESFHEISKIMASVKTFLKLYREAAK